MNIINFQSHTQYKILEFHYYIGEEQINIIELLIDAADINSIESNFTDTFIIETDISTFVCSDYELSEYYLDGNGIRVICIK